MDQGPFNSYDGTVGESSAPAAIAAGLPVHGPEDRSFLKTLRAFRRNDASRSTRSHGIAETARRVGAWYGRARFLDPFEHAARVRRNGTSHYSTS